MRPHDSLGRAVAWYRLVDVELIPFGIGHLDSVMIQTLCDDRAQPRGTETNEPRRLSLDPLLPGAERRTATTARVHVDVDAVLDRLLLGDDLEPDARTLIFRILDDVRATANFVPSGTPIDLKKSSHESKPDGGPPVVNASAGTARLVDTKGNQYVRHRRQHPAEPRGRSRGSASTRRWR